MSFLLPSWQRTCDILLDLARIISAPSYVILVVALQDVSKPVSLRHRQLNGGSAVQVGSESPSLLDANDYYMHNTALCYDLAGHHDLAVSPLCFRSRHPVRFHRILVFLPSSRAPTHTGLTYHPIPRYFFRYQVPSGAAITSLSRAMVAPILPRAATYYLWPALHLGSAGVLQQVLDGRSGTWCIGGQDSMLLKARRSGSGTTSRAGRVGDDTGLWEQLGAGVAPSPLSSTMAVILKTGNQRPPNPCRACLSTYKHSAESLWSLS